MTTVIALPDHSERGHSPLGASGAERWMNCAGSVTLIKRLSQLLAEMQMPAEDDPDYRREGTALHEASEHCLRTGVDSWEIAGETFNETVIDQPMADAVQVYVDKCRSIMDRAKLHYIEFPVSSPKHPDFYGTLDFAAVVGEPATKEQMAKLGWADPFIVPTEVIGLDLKGGEGILVEPEENPQLKYYLYGLIDKNPHWPDETPVLLGIVQPRAYHPSGEVIRTWSTTVGAIRAWVDAELIPAMLRTELDDHLEAGEWCRFCPAKLVCPLLTSLFRAACTANPKEIVNFNDESLGRSWQYREAVKHYMKALDDEVYRRLNAGREFPGVAKLVPKKANRVWNSQAEAEAKKRFGDDAWTKPALKSPAELEKDSPKAKEFVKEYAFIPNTGLTVAKWDDPKAAVKVTTSTEAFGAAVAKLGDTE